MPYNHSIPNLFYQLFVVHLKKKKRIAPKICPYSFMHQIIANESRHKISTLKRLDHTIWFVQSGRDKINRSNPVFHSSSCQFTIVSLCALFRNCAIVYWNFRIKLEKNICVKDLVLIINVLTFQYILKPPENVCL